MSDYRQLIIIDHCKAGVMINGNVIVLLDGTDTERLTLVFNDLEAARKLADEMTRLIAHYEAEAHDG